MDPEDPRVSFLEGYSEKPESHTFRTVALLVLIGAVVAGALYRHELGLVFKPVVELVSSN